MLALYFATSLFFFLVGIAAFFLGVYELSFFWSFLSFIFLIVFIRLGKRLFIFIFLAFLFFCLGQLRANNYFVSSYLVETPEELQCFVEDSRQYNQKREIFLTCFNFGKIFFTQDKDNKSPILSFGEGVIVSGEVTPVYDSQKNKEKYFHELKGEIKNVKNVKQKPLSIRAKSFFKKLNIFFHQKLEIIYPEPHSSIISAVLLGNKKFIDRDFSEQFSKAGISHIMVISGFHIMIVAQIFNKLFGKFGKLNSFVLTMFFLIFFVLLVGANISAVRALIMASVVLLSEHSGRDYYPITSILLAGFVMVYQNPYILLYDVSFQLSFFAVLGIVYLKPSIQSFLKLKGYLAEVLSVTLAAQIATLPLIIYYFEKISLFGFLANIVIVPLLPILMLFSASSLLLSLIKIEMGFFLGFFSWVIVQFILWVVAVVANLAHSSINLRQPLVVFFIPIFIICFKLLRLKYEE